MPALGAAEWTELVASTLENHEGTPVDQIFTLHPTLDVLSKYAKPDSGREFVLNLEVADADETEVTDRSGTFNTDANDDHIGAAVYQWSNPYVGKIRLTWQDLEENTGKHQIVNLLESKTANVKKGHARKIALGLHKPHAQINQTAAGREFLSLDSLISDEYEVGGIDPVANDWWRAQVLEIAANESATGYQPIRKAFRTMRNELAVANGAGSKVTHVIAGRDVFEEFEDSFDDKIRYVFDGSQPKDGQAQFRGVYDGDTEVRLDPDAPANVAYFIDVDTMRFKHLNDNMMKVKTEQVITGTFETVIPLATVLSLGTNQRRANAKLIRDYTTV